MIRIPLVSSLLLGLSLLVSCGADPGEPAPDEPDEPDECGEDELLDAGVCVPASCGLGPWAGIDRSGQVVYVATWGSADGDGSEEQPVDTVGLAVELASDGAADKIAVDLGTYEQSLSFSRSIGTLRIEGRCAAGVTLLSSSEVQPALAVLGGSVELTKLAVRGGQPAVFAGTLDEELGTQLSLAEVLVADASTGLAASGPSSRVDLTTSEIRNCQSEGVRVEAGASVTANALVVEAVRGTGMIVSGSDSSVVLADSEIRETQSDSDSSGVGLVVEAMGTVEATRLVIAQGGGPGAIVAGALLDCETCTLQANGLAALAALTGAQVRLEGGTISGSLPTEAQPHGGVGLFADGTDGYVDVSLTAVTLQGHSGPAVYLQGPGRYVIDDCTLDDSGNGAGVQALLAALDGVPRWENELGLLVRNSALIHVPLDGALLHASSALFDGSTFESGGGFDIWTQECAGIPAPIDTSGDAVGNDCEGALREVEPRVQVELP